MEVNSHAEGGMVYFTSCVHLRPREVRRKHGSKSMVHMRSWDRDNLVPSLLRSKKLEGSGYEIDRE